MQNGKIYNCWKCGSSFKQRTSLSRHLSEVHERRYRFTCPVCGTHFKRKGDCLRHISRRHKGADISPEDLTAHVTIIKEEDKVSYGRLGHFEVEQRDVEGLQNSSSVLSSESESYASDEFENKSQHSVNISSVTTETVTETPRNRIGETERLPSSELLVKPHLPVSLNGSENLCVRKKVKVTRYPNGKTVTVTTYFRHCKSNESGYGSSSSSCISDDEQ